MNDLRRRFRRRFAIISTAVTLAAAAGVTLLIIDTYWSMLMSMGQRRQTEIANNFYAAALARQGRFIDEARGLDPKGLPEHPATRALHELALSFARPTNTIRLAIYDRDGFTIFSTNPREIGRMAASGDRIAVARDGRISSKREPRDGVPDLDGVQADRKIFESYVPVTGADGRQAIVAVNSDATGYAGIFFGNLTLLLVAVCGALFAVLGMLIFYVGRDRVLAEQQRRNTTLTETVRQAEETSRLKSRFVASMGHELRTPLNAIIGFSEAMKHRLFGPLGSPKYDEYVSTIHASGRHLLAVVDDVLDMARIESGKATLNEADFDLGTALLECGRVIAPEAGRQGLVFDVLKLGHSQMVRGDESKIKQILLNLLVNAVRYTPKGGSVTLSAERQPDGAISVAVADTGIGIPADQIGRLFEPFRQADNAKKRNAGGLGLGLSISKAFADLHQATLTLESRQGQGTIARLMLPSARCPLAPALPAAA